MNTTNTLPLESIVTADLEALLMPDNSQMCYMAAWYGFKGGLGPRTRARGPRPGVNQ